MRDPEKKRIARNKSAARVREARIAEGLCVRCGDDAAIQRKYCRRCLDTAREQNAARRRRTRTVEMGT